MKIEKVEKYDAGYSRTDLLKKGSAAIAATLLMCGSLTSCSRVVGGYAGDMDYPDEYDGGMDYVSYSDLYPDVSSDDELELDGDVVYSSNDSQNCYVEGLPPKGLAD